MMGLLVDDISARLVSLGIAEGATGWALARDHRPDTPNDVIVLTQYAGAPPASARSGAQIQRPGLQVLVRSMGRAAAEAKIGEVAAALDDPGGPDFTVNGTRYMRVEAQQSAALLETDSSDRFVFIQNFICWR